MNVMTLLAISTGAGVGFRFILKRTAYQNNSLVSLADIGEGRDALFCIANQTACCRPPYFTRAIGNWYFPNGTRVPSSGQQWDLHRTRGQMVVLLHRRRGGENGIYRCEVPDATNVTQTIYIGVYTGSPGECPLDQGVLYSMCRDGPILKSHWVLLTISRELELASTAMLICLPLYAEILIASSYVTSQKCN